MAWGPKMYLGSEGDPTLKLVRGIQRAHSCLLKGDAQVHEQKQKIATLLLLRWKLSTTEMLETTRERERENSCNFREFFLLGVKPRKKRRKRYSWFELSRPLKSETNNIKMMLYVQEGNEDAQDDWIHAGRRSFLWWTCRSTTLRAAGHEGWVKGIEGNFGLLVVPRTIIQFTSTKRPHTMFLLFLEAAMFFRF